jgi:hypothetical protein
MTKGSSKCISVVKRVVPQSWGTSNGTFVTDRVGDIEISFVEYSDSKKVRLQPDIVEYIPGDQTPMYVLSEEHSKGLKTKSGASSVRRAACLKGLSVWKL